MKDSIITTRNILRQNALVHQILFRTLSTMSEQEQPEAAAAKRLTAEQVEARVKETMMARRNALKTLPGGPEEGPTFFGGHKFPEVVDRDEQRQL